MSKMSVGDVKTILSAERTDALSAMQASKLSSARSSAMDYYMGDMTNDMPSPEGRSAAVSTDVSDTIEGLMPELMDIFTGGEQVVKFMAIGKEDAEAADQETDYVNHVFMQKNPGFMILYAFMKDALLSKVGIVKVAWEKEERESRQTFYDLDDAQFTMLAGDPKITIVEHTEKLQPGDTDDDEPKESENGKQDADPGRA